MIVYALIVRTKDGLPLSASTDFNHEINRNIKENKKYVKLVGNKANQLPEKCVLQLKDFTVFMVTARGVSYLVMTEFHYPSALAFSFLNELMKEFMQIYHTDQLNSAKRPFHFIEFDSFIHKTRHAYNKPQSLAARVNLIELNTELNLRPPLRLAVTDVEPLMNGSRYANVPQMGVGPPPKLEPLTWMGLISIIFSSLLIALGIFRGFVAVHVSNVEIDGASGMAHGFFYTLEAFLRSIQVYLLMFTTKRRLLISWLISISLFLCIYILWEFRSPFQHGVFALSTVLSHACTMRRGIQPRLPDYHI